jgi:hypothetical protein
MELIFGLAFIALVLFSFVKWPVKKDKPFERGGSCDEDGHDPYCLEHGGL